MAGRSGDAGGAADRSGPLAPPRRTHATMAGAPPPWQTEVAHGLTGSARLTALLAIAVLVSSAVLALSVADRGRGDERPVLRAGLVAGGSGSSDGAGRGSDPAPASTTDRAAATSTTAATTTGIPARRRLTLAFSGDVLPHVAVNEAAARYGAGAVPHDFRPMFAPLAAVLGPVDVAVCHLEVPLAPVGEEVTSYPSFGAPAELVDGLASAGYDGCSTASNHSLDRGRAGIDHTLARMDLFGLRHTGTARTPEERRPAVYEVDGARVAHLSYAYGFNGYRVPDDAPWSVNGIDPVRIREDAAAARAAGADLVVVSLHWGDEYVHDPSPYQREVAAALVPSPDIDLVVGHHAHVVQPIERIDGTYVVWGLGNQLSNMEQPHRRDGLTAVVAAEAGPEGRWTVTGVEAVPTWVEPDTFRVLPVVPVGADPATPEPLRAELRASYDRTVEVLLGAPTPGLTVAPRP